MGITLNDSLPLLPDKPAGSSIANRREQTIVFIFASAVRRTPESTAQRITFNLRQVKKTRRLGIRSQRRVRRRSSGDAPHYILPSHAHDLLDTKRASPY